MLFPFDKHNSFLLVWLAILFSINQSFSSPHLAIHSKALIISFTTIQQITPSPVTDFSFHKSISHQHMLQIHLISRSALFNSNDYRQHEKKTFDCVSLTPTPTKVKWKWKQREKDLWLISCEWISDNWIFTWLNICMVRLMKLNACSEWNISTKWTKCNYRPVYFDTYVVMSSIFVGQYLQMLYGAAYYRTLLLCNEYTVHLNSV